MSSASSQLKFVRPTLGSVPSSVPRLTLSSSSPRDLAKQVSRELRKPSPPVAKAKTSRYPNTKMAMHSRQSLFNVANELLKSVFAKSLKIVKQRPLVLQEPRTESRRTEPRLRLRLLLPNLAKIRFEDESVFWTAVNFVDGLIGECNRRVIGVHSHRVERFKAYRTPHDFTIADGVELVLRQLGRWSLNRHWQVKVLYAGRNTQEQDSYYYTARLSVPTLAYPVAQVTVDVHFTVDVTLMVPPPVQIDVWYRVETDRSRRSALTDSFNEEWIKIVVRRKLATFKMLDF